MDMTRERLSVILEPVAMLLSFQMTFSSVIAPVVLAVPESAWGFDSSPDTIVPRYIKLWTVSSYLW